MKRKSDPRRRKLTSLLKSNGCSIGVSSSYPISGGYTRYKVDVYPGKKSWAQVDYIVHSLIPEAWNRDSFRGNSWGRQRATYEWDYKWR